MDNIAKKSNIPDKRRRLLANGYTLSLLLGYLLISGSIMIYLSLPPVYESSFSIVLPGKHTSSRIALQNVGQVQKSTSTAISNNLFSPLSNYKQILVSDAIRSNVAQKMQLSSTSVEKPSVKILQQTSIISVKMRAKDAASAQALSWAVYEGFESELNRLRMDEVDQHDNGTVGVLAVHQARLDETRQAILNFQARSLLVSTEQVNLLGTTLNNLREQVALTTAEKRSQEQFVQRLSLDLGVSPELAGSALALQSDAQFTSYLAELDQAAAQVSKFTAQWGEAHPRVVSERQRFNEVLGRLAVRSEKLVGLRSAQVLHSMNLNGSTQMASLFSGLLDGAARSNALDARLNQMQLEEARLDDRLRVYSREAAELERLEREHQRAEAIYSAAAAQLEAGRGDIFASYPIVQMLEAPGIPEDPRSPRLAFALLTGALGSVFFTAMVLLLWQRQRIITFLLKKD